MRDRREREGDEKSLERQLQREVVSGRMRERVYGRDGGKIEWGGGGRKDRVSKEVGEGDRKGGRDSYRQRGDSYRGGGAEVREMGQTGS